MNRRGFTLIEMLTVITIIAIISLLAVPGILGMIKQSEENKYKLFKENLFLATETYIEKNIDNYPELNTIGGTAEVSILDLVLDKLIKISTMDPKYCTGNTCAPRRIGGCTDNSCSFHDYKITVTKESNGTYSYELSGGDGLVYPTYLYASDNINNVEGSITRPTAHYMYLRYTLLNGEVPSGQVPEACMYASKYGGELCLKHNEFSTSYTKIADYFGYDANTWTNTTGNKWQNPDGDITCTVRPEQSIVCTDTANYTARALTTSASIDVMVGKPQNYAYCVLQPDGSASCYY